ncbi:MAG: hypothetical protein KDD65_16505 [Bacteroidetes bacterium]|nr:hypothetical protein [Bacteroidota bacterium]
MQKLLFTLIVTVFLVLVRSEPPLSHDDVAISGRVLDADSRILVPNVRVDVLDLATGDTLARDIRTDSLGRFAATISTTAIDPGAIDPSEPTIESIYPTPVSDGDVRIAYRAPVDRGIPTVEVFDASGRRVGSEVRAAGIYFARLAFEDGSMTNARPIAKLSGSAATFTVQRLDGKPNATTFGKASTLQTIQLVFSHPGYGTLTQDYETGGSLTDLTATVVPVLAQVEADSSVFDVTYDPDAIIIDASTRAALIEADTVRQVYTFDSAALATAGVTLTTGRPMLIEGLALRKITDVTQVGNQTVVETAFAPLTDAISDGHIAWRHTAMLDSDAMQQALMAGKGGEFSPDGLKMQFKYKEGDYNYVVQFELNPTDTVRTEVIVQVTKKIDGNLKATFIGKGKLKQFQSSGDLSISNNQADEVDISNDNVKLEMELSLAAAGSGLGDFSWKMPEVGLPIKFLVGSIPVTVNVRVQFVLKMKVQNEASATAKTTMSYDGSSGFHYDGVDVSVNHQTINHLFHGTNADSGANIGNLVDAQLGIAFPKIDVDIFAVPIVPNFLVGFVVGTNLSWGPVCKSGYTRIDIKAGADFKILNLSTTIADTTLWTEKRESAPC